MEEKDGLNSITPEETITTEEIEKKPYHPPTLTNHGNLVELVKGTPGPDAGPVPGCGK